MVTLISDLSELRCMCAFLGMPIAIFASMVPPLGRDSAAAYQSKWAVTFELMYTGGRGFGVQVRLFAFSEIDGTRRLV